ncbi:MAG: hypothetical protein WD013_03465 [Gemmatimonadota bacterium]
MTFESPPVPDAANGSPEAMNGSVQPQRRVQALVALALLEALRDQDRPSEVLDDENVSMTLPRRLGLSGVVDSQIRRYTEEARRGRRVPASEVRDLIRLVTRRPDAALVFRQVGRSLTAAAAAPRWRKVLPGSFSRAMAARRVRRRLHALFGRRFARTSRSPFHLEVLPDLLVDVQSGGDPCALVTGLSQAILEAYGEPGSTVVHLACRSRGDDHCRWGVAEGL